MSTPSLPVSGQSDWASPLNDYIDDVVYAEAQLAENTITTHQVAADPHGDKAYALSLVQPITTGTNQANGYVKLDSTGKIPITLTPPGNGRSATFDVIKDYAAPVQATSTGIQDCSTAIQNALNACNTNGGGEVWFGAGYYGVGATLTVYPGTWLHLSPGAVLIRCQGATSGQIPRYLVTNYGSSSTKGNGSVLVTGGQFVVSTSNITTAGAALVFAGASNIRVSGVHITGATTSPSVILAGISDAEVDSCVFTYPAPGSASRSTCASYSPAVAVNPMNSSGVASLPSSMAPANAVCSNIRIHDNGSNSPVTSDSYGVYSAVNGIAGATASTSGAFHTMIVVNGNWSTGFPGNGVNGINWSQVTVTGNAFNLTDGTDVVLTWNGTQPSTAWLTAEGNTPPDTWHDFRPCNPGFNGTNSGNYPPQYRLSDDRACVELYGVVQLSSSSKNNVSVFTNAIPAAYRASLTAAIPLAVLGGGGETAYIRSYPDGTFRFDALPGSLSTSMYVVLTGSYPLDGTNGLIES